MILLPEMFIKHGRAYKCVECTDDWRIWQVNSEHTPYFEGHLRKYGKDTSFLVDGKKILHPAAEAYPGNEAFGKWAWTNRSRDKVREDLVQALERKAAARQKRLDKQTAS